MASDDELEDFEEGWPERLPTCAAKCFLFVFEDERMTCLDFGHHSCLCRPIRMTSDADSLFNDCMYHYCVTEDVKGMFRRRLSLPYGPPGNAFGAYPRWQQKPNGRVEHRLQ